MKLRTCLVHALFIGTILPAPIEGYGGYFLRHARAKGQPIQLGCQGVIQKPGEYIFKSNGRPEGEAPTPVCVTYFIAPPDMIVEIEFLDFTISCATMGHEGILQIFDGMEIAGHTFPGYDHPLPHAQRYRLYCSQRNVPTETFTSNQNVAMINTIVPATGEGYKIRVQFKKHSRPCNVYLSASEGIYTLSNHGMRNNCSAVVSMFGPATAIVDSVNIGATIEGVVHTKEVGVSQKMASKLCLAKKKKNYAEFLYGNTIEPSYMAYSGILCGMKTNNVGLVYDLPCQMSVVRLVSSGEYYNSITFQYGPMEQKKVGEFSSMGITCS
ncbi:corticotropin-releasing factor-binding protein-like [Tubulanus polymorphus]|uniref:corticotropin-releasing factor-binding protein-like n=1 Tax=Tubulanus polymorphus TaxID=672921 RepID=UPI003DA40E28